MFPDNPVLLFIDDDVNYCRLASAFFTSRGFDVLFGFSGKTAQEILAKVKPDLIFLDLKMPEMDGKTFLRWLRQGSKVPVIVITGFPDEISSLESEAFEIQGFFTKPVKFQELLEKTQEILKLPASD